VLVDEFADGKIVEGFRDGEWTLAIGTGAPFAGGQAGRGVAALRSATCSCSGTTVRYHPGMAAQEKSERRTVIVPAQSRMARGALKWGVRDLAKAAIMSHDTVVRFERGDELKTRTVAAIQEAFERHGIEFLPDEGGKGIGIRLRLDRSPKRKAKR
jgi:hypothetical protein